MKCHAAQGDTGRSNGRRGSLFHYYMMYLFLSAVLLTTAGLCLHTVLKADRLDADVSQHLKTLLRLDRQLRADAAAAEQLAVEPLTLTMTGTSATVRWSVDRNIVLRHQMDGDKQHSSERFVFRRGTELLFQNDTLTNGAVLQLQESPAIRDRDETDSVGTSAVARTLQIHIVAAAAATEETDDGSGNATARSADPDVGTPTADAAAGADGTVDAAPTDASATASTEGETP
ncbi:MAG: hypothetical protein RIK87_18255 [Fuerstiella sp.]